jgi:hypothetical protein
MSSGLLEVPFETGELQVAEGLEHWPTLREELLNFRRKINLKTAHDSYEHWRDSDHDDLVLACALACWGARRPGRHALTLVGTSQMGCEVPVSRSFFAESRIGRLTARHCRLVSSSEGLFGLTPLPDGPSAFSQSREVDR